MQDDRIFFPKLEFNIKRLPVRSYSYKLVENGTIFESTEKCFHVLLADESLKVARVVLLLARERKTFCNSNLQVAAFYYEKFRENSKTNYWLKATVDQFSIFEEFSSAVFILHNNISAQSRTWSPIRGV